ncbi:hypothetical protein JAAARDRAFT_116487 [Jaapia argillacea MUCL 33604]|uniref:Methionine aminopeptidase n=1 Tax=Jaapia argillacea MUCL 33604 TaxID=933084 RepID=A0A067QR87_9AGAM|nr:hypothetical protein JAAARDRAFT_116487 [Jaapia argillacea MUCL 33604]
MIFTRPHGLLHRLLPSLIRPTCILPNYRSSFIPPRHLFSTTLPNSSSETATVDSDDFGSYSIILPIEPFIWGTSHISPHPVPEHIPRPPYVPKLHSSSVGEGEHQDEFNGDPWTGDGRIRLGGEEEKGIRKAARLAKEILDAAGSLIKVGVTTNFIDASVHSFVTTRNAYPSPLLYSGFPKSCCTSVNNIIAHGIPDDRPLEDGDIVNIDITVYLDGYHGDTSRTFLVGNVDPRGTHLTHLTTLALETGISVCGPGKHFKEIGAAIHNLVHSERKGSAGQRWDYCVSQQFTGHGIGSVFHRPPWILHHRNDEPGIMLPGHCFTIEPCIIQGTNPRGWIFPDGWSTSTENCARSAQAEHMVLITETGAEVLTR